MMIRLKLAEKKRIEEIALALNDALPAGTWISYSEQDMVLIIHLPIAKYLKTVLKNKIAEIVDKVRQKINAEYQDYVLEAVEW